MFNSRAPNRQIKAVFQLTNEIKTNSLDIKIYWPHSEMVTRMVSILCISVLLGISCARQNLAKSEMEELQGAWQLVYQQGNGKRLPDERAADTFHGRMIFTGNKIRYSVDLPGFDFTFTYKLQPDQQPKAIDLELTDTVDKQGIGQKSFGIYLLEKDTLKICQSKTRRPTDFNAGEGSDNTLIVFKRKAPESP